MQDCLLSDGQRLARVILLPILIVVGVVGNLLVCIAVFKTPKLRKVVNYFIVSLALSDLLLCTIVIPLAIYQEYNHLKWGLERWVCSMWVTLDVLLCSASIWNLCLVSLDRYLAVDKPNWYAKWRTPRYAAILILAIITATMLHFGTRSNHSGRCVVNSTPAITVVVALVAFYIPCLFILVLYWKVYMAIKNYTQRHPSITSCSSETSSTDSTIKRQIIPNRRTNLSQNNSKIHQTRSYPKKTTTEKLVQRYQRRSFYTRRQKENKSAIVLSIVVVTFIGYWLPFFIVYLLQLCSCAENLALPEAFNATTWLGWCNSLINPVIYTVFNKDFRRAFKKILLCGKREFKSHDSTQDK